MRQTGSQCGEDRGEVAVQTETSTTTSVGMQFPDDIGVGGSSGAAKGTLPPLLMQHGTPCVHMVYGGSAF